MEIKKVELGTINNGAAVELFQEEMEKVLKNINDISVDAEAVREIKLSFKIKPTHDRLSASVTIEAQSKLASVQKHSGSMFLSNKPNKIEAYVTNPHQQTMDFGQSQQTRQE